MDSELIKGMQTLRLHRQQEAKRPITKLFAQADTQKSFEHLHKKTHLKIVNFGSGSAPELEIICKMLKEKLQDLKSMEFILHDNDNYFNELDFPSVATLLSKEHDIHIEITFTNNLMKLTHYHNNPDILLLMHQNTSWYFEILNNSCRSSLFSYLNALKNQDTTIITASRFTEEAYSQRTLLTSTGTLQTLTLYSQCRYFDPKNYFEHLAIHRLTPNTKQLTLEKFIDYERIAFSFMAINLILTLINFNYPAPKTPLIKGFSLGLNTISSGLSCLKTKDQILLSAITLIQLGLFALLRSGSGNASMFNIEFVDNQGILGLVNLTLNIAIGFYTTRLQMHWAFFKGSTESPTDKLTKEASIKLGLRPSNDAG